MNEPQPINESTAAPLGSENGEKAFSENYKKALDSLLADGWQPRKARRYLDSIAKKNMKKFMKQNKGKVQEMKQVVHVSFPVHLTVCSDRKNHACKLSGDTGELITDL